MATKLLSSSKFNCSSDVSDDFKYICGLSTILVATIQEVKDRVSQIEFIFCSQLFPNFQSKSKLLQTTLADAKRAADEEWRKKEAGLLNQIEELLIEKKHFKEQIQQLNNSLEENKINLVSNEHLANKIETEKKQLLEKLECLMGNEEIVKELKKQLEEKSNEVAQGKELLQRLLKQIELKDQSMLAEQRKRRDLVEDFNTLKTNYKQLKSQYNFLLGKIGNTRVNMYCLERAGEARNMPRPHLNKRSLQGMTYLILLFLFKCVEALPPASCKCALREPIRFLWQSEFTRKRCLCYHLSDRSIFIPSGHTSSI